MKRAALAEQLENLRARLTALDKEYLALKSLLTASDSDGRWESHSAGLLEAVHVILRDAKRPLHYKEINRRLQNQSYYIIGSASLSNLVVRLSRDSRFAKVGRGLYALREWHEARDVEGIARPTLAYPDDDGNNRHNELPSVAEERYAQRLKFILESVNVDIQVTQNSLKALRDKLLGKETRFDLPHDVDPVVALPALERKLGGLLEQERELSKKLGTLEARNK